MRRFGPKPRGMTVRCEICETEFYRKPASARRFCSRSCWRKWYVNRFRGYVVPELDLRGVKSYDRYMTMQNLTCLVKGCSWRGQDLGHHVSNVHGIRARDFKRLAGFNLGTGLVAPLLNRKLSGRSRESGIFTRRGRGPKRSELSKEGREHYDKAMRVRRKAA